MAFRLIRYAVAAMQRHLEAGHKKLPLVIPVLFYTGKRSPYPYSTRWLDEFDDPALAGKLYSSAFPLVDVTVIPDDEIAGHRSMAALTLLQKHIHQRDLAERSALTGRASRLRRSDALHALGLILYSAPCISRDQQSCFSPSTTAGTATSKNTATVSVTGPAFPLSACSPAGPAPWASVDTVAPRPTVPTPASSARAASQRPAAPVA